MLAAAVHARPLLARATRAAGGSQGGLLGTGLRMRARTAPSTGVLVSERPAWPARCLPSGL
jgi:hypothetical protein